MLFLIFSNANNQFVEKKHVWITYNITKALLTTDKEEFAKVGLDENIDAFVLHVSCLKLGSMMIDLARESQMSSLLSEKVIVLTK